MAHRGATYTNDQVREFLQVGAHFELAKHAVGRRRSKHWVPAELARPTLRESCPTAPYTPAGDRPLAAHRGVQ